MDIADSLGRVVSDPPSGSRCRVADESGARR